VNDGSNERVFDRSASRHKVRRQRPEADLLAGDPVLAEIVRRLTETLHPDRIYLFGSRARGDAGQESDYDLLVLVDRPAEPRYRLSLKGFQSLRGIPASVDVVVWDRQTFDARVHLAESFPATVLREGKLVHAA
jgi:predicted nucleotidyltransferase